MQNTFAISVIHLLYDEARRSRPPGRQRVCQLLGASPEAVDEALTYLEKRGLVDRGRTRLTLAGLAYAAATFAARRSAGGGAIAA